MKAWISLPIRDRNRRIWRVCAGALQVWPTMPRRLRESPLFGSVGVLSPDKGHELLIRALAQLRKEYSGCRLLLAGEGPSRAMLEALAKELGVSQR